MSNKTITIPERLQARFQSLVERTADRFGESPAQARRIVELSVLDRGMNMLDNELAVQEAKAHERAVKRNGHAIPRENQALSSGALQAFEREHGRKAAE
jgi:hypothetical protein